MQMQARTREVVAEMRAAISSAVAESAASPLARVVTDPDFGCVLVVKVLDVHPCLGKVAGRRLMAGASVAPSARLADLTDAQRRSLVTACRCAS